MMDFHSLSRRELQALCKKNKIRANMKNLEMADALSALTFVEGIEDYTGKSQLETHPIACRKTPSREPTIPLVDLTENEPESSLPQSRRSCRAPRRLIQEEEEEESKESKAASENVPLTEIPKTPTKTRTVRERVTGTLVSRETDTQTKENEIPAVSRAFSMRRCATLQQSEPKTSESVPKSVGRRKRRREAINKVDMLSEEEEATENLEKESNSEIIDDQVPKNEGGATVEVLSPNEEDDVVSEDEASEKTVFAEECTVEHSIVDRDVKSEEFYANVMSAEVSSSTDIAHHVPDASPLMGERAPILEDDDQCMQDIEDQAIENNEEEDKKKLIVLDVESYSLEDKTQNLENSNGGERLMNLLQPSDQNQVNEINEEDEQDQQESVVISSPPSSKVLSSDIHNNEPDENTVADDHGLENNQKMVQLENSDTVVDDDDDAEKLQMASNATTYESEAVVELDGEKFSANANANVDAAADFDLTAAILDDDDDDVVHRLLDREVVSDSDVVEEVVSDAVEKISSYSPSATADIALIQIPNTTIRTPAKSSASSKNNQIQVTPPLRSSTKKKALTTTTSIIKVLEDNVEENEISLRSNSKRALTVVVAEEEKENSKGGNTHAQEESLRKESLRQLKKMMKRAPTNSTPVIIKVLEDKMEEDNEINEKVSLRRSNSKVLTEVIVAEQDKENNKKVSTKGENTTTSAKSSASSENNQIQVTPPLRSSTKKKAPTTTTPIIKVLEDNAEEENEIEDIVSLRRSNSKRALTIVVAEEEKENSKGENTHAQEVSLRKESLRRLKKMMKRAPTNSSPVIIKVLEDKMEEYNEIDEKVSLRRKSNSKVLTEVVVAEQGKENNKKASTKGENTTTAQEESLRKKSLRQLKKMIKQRADDRKKILVTTTTENNNKNTVFVKEQLLKKRLALQPLNKN